jgi:sulfite reductase (NADPH) hemoprotein beta-component
MYTYDTYDQKMVDERVDQYRDQTERFLAGKIPADEFQQLRLRNGLYVQRLAPMLRIAVPYGMLTSTQLRKVAHITRHFDKGYAHFTTRQNIQLNWPLLEEVPDILAELATVQMHAIQTSGSCVRNVTTDQYAGSAQDEIEDSRPWAELLRQWSTFHPEFNWLPRKFKIAVTGAREDRAVIQVHDIGIRIIEQDGEIGFQILVGGGLGRTPVIGSVIKEFLPKKHLLSYVEAVLRVYNRYGRRDNKYKARIKILVRAMTPEVFAEKTEIEWASLKDGPSTLTDDDIASAKACFSQPNHETLSDEEPSDSLIAGNKAYQSWLTHNVQPHRVPGYAIVNFAIKSTGVAPGDAPTYNWNILQTLLKNIVFQNLELPTNKTSRWQTFVRRTCSSFGKAWLLRNLRHRI